MYSETSAQKKVIFIGGGTAGHVRPGQHVARAMPASWSKYWVGNPESIEENIISADQGIKFIRMKVLPWRGRSVIGRLMALLSMEIACIKSLWLLIRIRPHLVFATGGYVTVPLGFVAWLFGVKLIIHESNAVMGLANKLLSRFATRILVGFSEVKVVDKVKGKVVEVGNPVGDSLYNLEVVPREGDEVRVLVIGGSLGAEVFNDLVPSVKFPRQVKIMHQCGKDEVRHNIERSYAKNGVSAEVFAFDRNMAARYARTDAIICRAGAMTCAEVEVVGVPVLLVPYPYAVDNHQMANAKQLALRCEGLVTVCAQEDLGVDYIAKWLASVQNMDDGGEVKAGNKIRSVSKIMQVINSVMAH